MTYPQGGPDSGHTGDSSYGARYSAQPDFGGGDTYQVAGGPPDQRSGKPWPPSNVGWAVASVLFFWPLAFVAMSRALEVYPLWAAGRHAEAQAASATAKKLGIIAMVIFGILLVLYSVFITMMVDLLASEAMY